jgi:nitrite reductase (NO-forming)
MQTDPTLQHQETSVTWLIAATSAVRAAFGIVWAINAYLTWWPEFADHYVGYLQNAAQNQPGWLVPWFSAWLALVTPAAGSFIWLTRIIETAIALGLLLGLARKWLYLLGALFSLLIWSTAGGFGGPYTTGATNLGPSLVYVLVFIALAVLNRALGRTPYSVDYYLEQRWPAWDRVAEWVEPALRRREPPRLSWRGQGFAIAGIIIALVLFFGTLQSALHAAPATPANAAAAVAPLSLANNEKRRRLRATPHCRPCSAQAIAWT